MVVALAYLFLWDDHVLDPVPIPWGQEEEAAKKAEVRCVSVSVSVSVSQRRRRRRLRKAEARSSQKKRDFFEGEKGTFLHVALCLCAWM
jgi:hypothetical protein